MCEVSHPKVTTPFGDVPEWLTGRPAKAVCFARACSNHAVSFLPLQRIQKALRIFTSWNGFSTDCRCEKALQMRYSLLICSPPSPRIPLRWATNYDQLEVPHLDVPRNRRISNSYESRHRMLLESGQAI